MARTEFTPDTIEAIGKSLGLLLGVVVDLTEKFVVEAPTVETEKLAALAIASHGGADLQGALEWLIAEAIGVHPEVVHEWFDGQFEEGLESRAMATLESAKMRMGYDI